MGARPLITQNLPQEQSLVDLVPRLFLERQACFPRHQLSIWSKPRVLSRGQLNQLLGPNGSRVSRCKCAVDESGIRAKEFRSFLAQAAGDEVRRHLLTFTTCRAHRKTIEQIGSEA